MARLSWIHNIWTLIIASIVLPIVGLLLLWYQKNRPIALRIVGTLLLLGYGVVYGLGSAYVLLKIGVLEPSGGMNGIFISWANSEFHYSQLEKNRSGQEGTASIETQGAVYWTDFRGPNRDGVYDQSGVSLDLLSNELNQLWKQPIGGGYASFVIANGVAYTIEQRRDKEAAVAYHVKTGDEIWAYEWDAKFVEALGGPGPRATPTWHDGKLYVLGATGEFYCLNAETGEPIWNLNILEDNNSDNIQWGMACAPLIVDDLVVVVPGGKNGNTVVAYDKETGEKQWGALDDGVEYSSPMLVNLLGKRQILQITKSRVVGLEPTTGELLWSYKWDTGRGIKIAQPIVVNDHRIFLSTGYGYGCDLIEISEGNDGIQVDHLWHNRLMKNKLSSSVLHEGHVYGLDEGILVCLNAETGDRVWKQGRYGHGQLLLANGVLIVLSERGELSLVKAVSDQYEEIKNLSAISGKTWNNPAISDGYLLVRNASEMACFEL